MSLIIDIKITPSSSKQVWNVDSAGRLKCYLKNPPERGLANKELLKLLSKAVGCTQQDIMIIAGFSSRNKKIKIAKDITFAQLLALLGIEIQQTLW